MSEAHFQKVYQEYQSLVRAVLFRACGEKDLDDLVQETFIKIFQGLKGFKGESNMKTWIYQIAINTARDYQRSQMRRRWLSFFGSTQENESNKISPKEESVSNEGDTYNKTSDSDKFEAKHDIEKLLQVLSPKLRETIILFSIDELSIEEISRILEIPEGTVKSRLSLAKQELAAELKRLEKRRMKNEK